jgi:putative FmdB family regulatory protein
MPIYEYQCAKCGVFEVTQRITESPLKKCPTCKAKVERIISATSFILKGSGWYVTDYARSGSAAKPESSSSEAPASSGAASSTPSANGGANSSPASGESSAKSTSEKSTTTKAAD